ncbi:MAG: hypothetical protein MMC33_008474 [Icmadophila ericetorum]|nr:hypothetical protein [Icmadophila ericetorum]
MPLSPSFAADPSFNTDYLNPSQPSSLGRKMSDGKRPMYEFPPMASYGASDLLIYDSLPMAEYGTRTTTGDATLTMLGYRIPQAAGYETPTTSGYGTPATGGYVTPQTPVFGTPQLPGYGNSSVPGFGSSQKPASGSPVHGNTPNTSPVLNGVVDEQEILDEKPNPKIFTNTVKRGDWSEEELRLVQYYIKHEILSQYEVGVEMTRSNALWPFWGQNRYNIAINRAYTASSIGQVCTSHQNLLYKFCRDRATSDTPTPKGTILPITKPLSLRQLAPVEIEEILTMLSWGIHPEDIKKDMPERSLWKEHLQGKRHDHITVDTIEHAQTWLTLHGRRTGDPTDPVLWARAWRDAFLEMFAKNDRKGGNALSDEVVIEEMQRRCRIRLEPMHVRMAKVQFAVWGMLRGTEGKRIENTIKANAGSLGVTWDSGDVDDQRMESLIRASYCSSA